MGAVEIDTNQIGAIEIGTVEIGVRTDEIADGETPVRRQSGGNSGNPARRDTSDGGAGQVGSRQRRVSQVGTDQKLVDLGLEKGLVQVGIGEVCTKQVGARKTSPLSWQKRDWHPTNRRW